MKKGNLAEAQVAAFLREQGWPAAERRVQGGRRDAGDIAGVPGWVVEVKNEQRLRLAEAVDEAAREAASAGARRFVAVLKRPGTAGRVGEWYAVMTMAGWADLASSAPRPARVEE